MNNLKYNHVLSCFNVLTRRYIHSNCFKNVYRPNFLPLLLQANKERKKSKFYISTSSPAISNDDGKIYTKTGDAGITSLFNGERRSKNDIVFDALGNVDELSSHLGLAKEYAEEKNHEYSDQLERIQCILQDIGTLIATPMPQTPLSDFEREKRRVERLSFNPRHVGELEEWIDQYTAGLPPLTNFILPGGGKASASLHVARSVCRRTERSILPLTKENLLDGHVLIYVNRLSDYLFTISRFATIIDGLKETIYIRPQARKRPTNLKDNQELLQY